jgi:hypothetical protein
MSIRAMQLIWQHSRAKGTALLVLLAIGDHATDDLVAWPGIQSLAKKCRCKERHLQQCLLHLSVDLQELAIDLQAGPHRTNRYRILLKNGAADPLLQGAVECTLTPPEGAPECRVQPDAGCTGVQGAPECRVQPSALEGAPQCTLRVHPGAPQPSVNRQEPTEGSRPTEGAPECRVQPDAGCSPVRGQAEPVVGSLVPSDDDVLLFARTFVDPARGITGIPEDYALRWLAFRTTPKAGPFPPQWQADLKRRFVADWVTTSRGETPLGGKVRSERLERQNRQLQAERLRARLDQTGLSPDERTALREQIQALEETP